MGGSGGEKEKEKANRAIHLSSSSSSSSSLPLVVSPPSASSLTGKAMDMALGGQTGGSPWLFEERRREREKGRGKIPGSVVIAEIDKILMEDHLATDFSYSSSSSSSSSNTPYSGPDAAWAIGLIQLRLKLLRTRSSEVFFFRKLLEKKSD